MAEMTLRYSSFSRAPILTERPIGESGKISAMFVRISLVALSTRFSGWQMAAVGGRSTLAASSTGRATACAGSKLSAAELALSPVSAVQFQRQIVSQARSTK